MKKVLTAVLVLSVPMLIFLNVWQVFRYREARETLNLVVEEQEKWLEQNRRVVGAITVYSSPGRVYQIAENQLPLQKLTPEQVVLIEFARGSGNE